MLSTNASIDAYYLELPAERPTLLQYGLAAVHHPLYVLGMCVSQMLYGPIYAVRSGRQCAVEVSAVTDVASETSIPSERIDTHPSLLVPRLSSLWTVLSWIGIGIFAFFAPIATGRTVALLLLITASLVAMFRRRSTFERALSPVLGWGGLILLLVTGPVPTAVILVGLAAHGLVLRQTLERRNEDMVARTVEDVTEHGYRNVCVVVGAKHLEGMVREFEARGFDVAVADFS
ncbi:hypothetical protein C477_04104 [Haloterrigena salina JCM 13891]|uniref:Uncharacterized protein n=1 Tax=Haloterrigena salina JCM 13891 TaxID=1227488 RepID=M0CL09_9EURY|nr:hypothetical protein [Haloterrigena salina]ELZ22549.1 hypothetical protein C477_04104 [Haloterrigena salina JCM 13891]